MAVAAASALAGKVGQKFGEDLYNWVRKKITGSGVKIPYHRTKHQKIQFIKDVVNKILINLFSLKNI